MAKTKGLVIEFDGKTTGLQKALKDVTDKTVAVNKELKAVDKSLKFNPGNIELLGQKQELLSEQILNTSNKLKTLKEAQEDVNNAFKNNEITPQQYREFNRELIQTESTLKHYESQLGKVKLEQKNLENSTKTLNDFFSRSGKSIDEFADVLGQDLVNAIKSGKADSSQLESAINKIGHASIDAGGDLGKLAHELKMLDNASGVKGVDSELKELEQQAGKTAEAVEGISDKLDANNLMEGADQLSELSDKILDIASSSFETSTELDTLVTKFNNNFGLIGEEAQGTKDKIVALYKSGFVDSYEQAYEVLTETKEQLQGLNDVELASISEKVANFANTFDADIPETLRGVNGLMQSFGLTADEAMNLIITGAQNGLNKTDELGDNIAEYATLWEESGYSAQEMFAMLEAGLEGGAYNLDKVNDLVKEFGIRINDGSVVDALDKMDGKFKDISQSIKDGSIDQKEAFKQIANEISNMNSEQEKASAISQIFGSLGEDAGTKVIEAMGEASKSISDVSQKYNDAGDASATFMEKSRTQELQANLAELKSVLEPLGNMFLDIANDILPPFVDMIKKMQDSFKEMGPIGQTIVEFIGIFLGLSAVLVPIAVGIAGVAAAFAALGVSILPIIAVIAVISAVIAGIIIVIQNWGAITDWLGQKWQDFTTMMSELGARIGEIISNAWNTVKTNTGNFVSDLINKFNNLKSQAVNKFDEIRQGVIDKMNAAKDAVSRIIDKIKGFLKFKWKLPEIGLPKLPRLSITGGFSINPPRVPRISWNAKGGIMTRPTAFDFDGHTIQAGGEAGPEAILPLNKANLGVIGDKIASHMSNNDDVVDGLYTIIGLLENLLNKNSDTYLDGKRVTAGLYGYQQEYSNTLETRNKRLKGAW